MSPCDESARSRRRWGPADVLPPPEAIGKLSGSRMGTAEASRAMLRRMYETKASPFEGELIRLRARERADLSTLNDLFNDPEVLAGLQMPFPQSMAVIREWAERTRSVNDQAIFAIEPLEDREPIGICGLE